jgi:hypothetical protein
MARVESPGTVLFTLDFGVENKEQLPAVRDTVRNRVLLNKMPLQVVFTTNVTVSSSPVDVFAPVLLIAAVTRSNVNGDLATPGAPITLELDVLTSLQWPFELSAAVASVAPSSRVASSSSVVNVEPASACSQTATDSLCLQRWRVTYTGLASICDFDGSYAMAFTVGCRTGRAGNCPIDAATDAASLAYVLDTPSFCPVVADNIGITAEMITYERPAFLDVKDDFLDAQRVYAEVAVTSATSSITRTVLWTVTFDRLSAGSPSSYTLIQNGAPVTTGAVAALAVTSQEGGFGAPGVASRSRFSFAISASSLALAEDAIVSFSLTALVRIQYENSGQVSVLHRAEFDTATPLATVGSQSDSVSRTIRINTAGASGRGSGVASQSRQVFGMPQAQAGLLIVGVAALVIIAVGAAVVVRHRRQRARLLAHAVSSSMFALNTHEGGEMDDTGVVVSTH